MEKLTFKQIIKKLKNIFDKVEDFAYEKQPYDFENYPEALKAQKVREDFRNKYYKNYIWEEDKQEEYNTLPNEYDIIKKLWQEKNGLNWEEVEQYGGEGKGDTWYSVKYFPDHDIYIRINGWYQSYNGTEFYDGWDSCTEVRPQLKTITIFE